MAAESRALLVEQVMVVPSGVHRDATGTAPLGPAVLPPRRRMTFAGGIAVLGGSILVALLFPILVIVVPAALLARLVLSVVWARTR